MTHKKALFAALILVCLGGTVQAHSDQYSRKTYLAVRPHGINTAMEYTTWHKHAYSEQNKTIRTHLQFTPFYQKSEQSGDLGKYFGIGNGKNSFTVGRTDAAAATKADIENGLLIHDQQAGIAANRLLAGTVNFLPYQEAYGIRLDLFQDINHPFANFFFKASTPIEHVATDVKMHIANGVNANLGGGTTFSLQEFFAGKVSVATGPNMQSQLTKVKIHGKRSETGLADLDVALGYKYIQDEKKHVFFSLDVTIPFGNKVRGEYLFEPVYGNGRHVGLGASLDTGFEIWHSDKANLNLLWVTRYKYLFEGTETRTLGVKDEKLGHYFLARPYNPNPVTGTDAQTNISLVPLANDLTTGFNVKPGSLFDTMLDFAFYSNNFTIDIGYSLFWKDGESAHGKLNETDFNNKKLTIAQAAFQTNAGGGMTAADVYKQIQYSNLDFDAVKTPALLTNKLFAGLGYSFTLYEKYKGSVGLGGSYEFATSNADLENYAVWVKAAFSF